MGINEHLCAVLNARQDETEYFVGGRQIFDRTKRTGALSAHGLFTRSLDSCLLVREVLKEHERIKAWSIVCANCAKSDVLTPSWCGTEHLARALAVATGFVEGGEAN